MLIKSSLVWRKRDGCRERSGLYLPVPIEATASDISAEDPWTLAMDLFAPCYISGWSAAEHWDLTEQIFNTTVVYTTHTQRKKTQKISGLSFRIHRIKESELFGTKRIWRNNVPVLIADLHTQNCYRFPTRKQTLDEVSRISARW